MKQKIVIRVSMNDDKCRSKALKTAVCVEGVESAALKGQEKDQMEVVGDIDSVELTRKLRKRFGLAELVSVEAVKKEEKEGKKPPEVVVMGPPYYSYGYPQYYCSEMREPACIIL